MEEQHASKKTKKTKLETKTYFINHPKKCSHIILTSLYNDKI